MRSNIVHLGLRDWLGLSLLAAVVVAFMMTPVSSQIPSGSQGPGGNGPTGMTMTNGSIPATSTAVTFTAASSYITITNLSSTTTLYVNAVSPATISNTPIAPNTSYSYLGSPLTVLYIIGSAASGSYGIW